ncbi:MAG: choice-of-anchor D domain-containing protein [Myxococcota bacterium]
MPRAVPPILHVPTLIAAFFIAGIVGIAGACETSADFEPASTADAQDAVGSTDDVGPADIPEADDGGSDEDADPGDASGPVGPRLEVAPEAVELGTVAVGDTATVSITVGNVGDAPLDVFWLSLSGDEAFSVTLGGQTWEGGGETAAGVVLDPSIGLAPGESVDVQISFAAVATSPAFGTLVLRSDGAEVGIPLSANTADPCVLGVEPTAPVLVDPIGGGATTREITLSGCEDAALVVEDVALDEAAPDAFGLDVSGLGEAPRVLGPGETATVEVAYTADEPAALDDQGQPVYDEARLQITADDGIGVHEVTLRGLGVEVPCAAPTITIAEGTQVIPQTVLHLDGSASTAPGGEVAAWEWTVQQPSGSHFLLQPSADVAKPTFPVHVAGTYVFRLRVTGEDGQSSCVPGEAVVQVVPAEAIHVELLWDTPGDPDPTDVGPEAGADLDLHFLHPFATGTDGDGDGEPDGWFDNPFDTYWYNAAPNWGSLDPGVDDNPSLDRDDTDGWGPENLNLAIPEDDATYRVGVHSWNDHGFGPSRATVRVYIHGALAFEWADVTLEEHDLWEVCTIHWPSADVTPLEADGGDPVVIPDYPSPFSPSD